MQQTADNAQPMNSNTSIAADLADIAAVLPDATPEAPPARFDTLPLDAKLLRAIDYPTMTIQAKAIPLVLAGRDVMGAAQTGTGKTAAFSIPLLQKMMKHENASMSPARHPVRAIVLAPTRELAVQVADNVKKYASKSNLRSAVVFGGMNMKEQTIELKAGVEVLIATPGRLIDHIEAKNCNLSQVEYVVLDEADRMLDIGFLPDLQRILSYLPKQRQTLLFSATFSPEIKKLAQSYLQDPILVEVARPNQTATNVEQRFYKVNDDDKRYAIRQMLRDRGITQSIVFVNSKLGAARLARAFERDGLRTQALHGDIIAGAQVVAVQLPCVFGAALQCLQRALDQHQPQLVLALGQAAGRCELTPERVAINVDDARIADNNGAQPVDSAVVPGGPAAYFSTLPIKAMVAALRAAGVPASVSQTAGTFVCNHVFYGLMHALHTRPGARAAVRGGFMHLPLLPEQAARLLGQPSLALATQTSGVRLALAAALATVNAGRDDLHATGGAEH